MDNSSHTPPIVIVTAWAIAVVLLVWAGIALRRGTFTDRYGFVKADRAKQPRAYWFGTFCLLAGAVSLIAFALWGMYFSN